MRWCAAWSSRRDDHGSERYFARVAPQVEMILADPAGSILADYVKTGRIGTAGSWLVEGIGEDLFPPSLICRASKKRTPLATAKR